MSEPKHYYGCDSHGFIKRVLFSDILPDDEFTYSEVVGDVIGNAATSQFMYKLIDGVATETDIPWTPPLHHEWSDDNGCYVDQRDLDGHKNSKWEEIKTARNASEYGEFSWTNYLFQCDEASRQRIQVAVQTAIIDSNTEFVWTLADNSTLTLDAVQIKQIGQALSNHISQCHERGRILRAQINAATTQEELEAIVW